MYRSVEPPMSRDHALRTARTACVIPASYLADASAIMQALPRTSDGSVLAARGSISASSAIATLAVPKTTLLLSADRQP